MVIAQSMGVYRMLIADGYKPYPFLLQIKHILGMLSLGWKRSHGPHGLRVAGYELKVKDFPKADCVSCRRLIAAHPTTLQLYYLYSLWVWRNNTSFLLLFLGLQHDWRLNAVDALWANDSKMTEDFIPWRILKPNLKFLGVWCWVLRVRCWGLQEKFWDLRYQNMLVDLLNKSSIVIFIYGSHTYLMGRRPITIL